MFGSRRDKHSCCENLAPTSSRTACEVLRLDWLFRHISGLCCSSSCLWTTRGSLQNRVLFHWTCRRRPRLFRFAFTVHRLSTAPSRICGLSMVNVNVKLYQIHNFSLDENILRPGQCNSHGEKISRLGGDEGYGLTKRNTS